MFFTKSPVSAVKNTSEEQEEREIQNMKEIYGLLALKICVVSEHAIETGPVPIGSRLGFNDHDILL